MHEVYLRLKNYKDNRIMEVCFDSRLSFADNLSLLKGISKDYINDYYVYDERLSLFIDTTVPLMEMNIERFNLFTLL